MGREVGGGIGMGKPCEPKAFSFQCMTKFTPNKKKRKEKKKKEIVNDVIQNAIFIFPHLIKYSQRNVYMSMIIYFFFCLTFLLCFALYIFVSLLLNV